MIRIFSYIIICFLSLFLLSCNRKFDKDKWAIKEDMEYPYRNSMIKDLTKNHKIIGLKYNDILNLLGNPKYSDSSSFAYEILIHYNGIDPDHIKNLELSFNKDSTITSFKIDEWKK